MNLRMIQFFVLFLLIITPGISRAETMGEYQIAPLGKDKYVTFYGNDIGLNDMVLAGGSLWLATDQGLVAYNLTSKTWSQATDSNQMLVDQGGYLAYQEPYLWYYNKSGLHRLNLSNSHELISWELGKDSFMKKFFYSMTADASNLWILFGDTPSGYLSNKVTPVITQLSSKDEKVIKNWEVKEGRPFKILSDDNQLWISEEDGISSMDESTGNFKLWDVNAKVGELGFQNGSWAADAKYVYFASGVRLPNGFLVKFDKSAQKWETLKDKFTYPVARQDNLIWVGASYDLDTSSRFVLRYLKDYETGWKDAFVYSGLMTKILPVNNAIWMLSRNTLMRWDVGSRMVLQFSIAFYQSGLMTKSGAFAFKDTPEAKFLEPPEMTAVEKGWFEHRSSN